MVLFSEMKVVEEKIYGVELGFGFRGKGCLWMVREKLFYFKKIEGGNRLDLSWFVGFMLGI